MCFKSGFLDFQCNGIDMLRGNLLLNLIELHLFLTVGPMETRFSSKLFTVASVGGKQLHFDFTVVINDLGGTGGVS